MPTATRTLPFVSAALKYCDDVITGRVPACRFVKLACERHLRDLETFKGKDAPYYFDADAANRVCDIVQRFPHIKGVWAQQRRKIDLEGWQCFILCVVFGWMTTATQSRRFRVAYIEVPRKNAKSTLTSALGNYLVACDNEAGAYVVSAANTRDQAKLVFADAQHMAKRERGFLTKFGVEVLAHTIVQPATASKFEALSAEHSNLDGLNIHAALIDELHAHPTRGLWDVLETATGSRSQPLIWAITTAGLNRASVCYEQRAHVIEILDKLVEDESYFGIIYTIDDGDDPYCEDAWAKANPNYGVSIYPDSLRITAARAQSMPSQQNAYLTKHLNVWVNADTAWLPSGAWDKCGDADLEILDFEHEQCYLGLDLAFRSDIADLVAYFPPTRTRDYGACFAYHYLPEDTIARGENTHYQGWETQGRIISTPGNVTNFDYILDQIADFCARFEVVEIASDPYKNLPIVTGLQKLGIRAPIVDMRQSPANMSPAMIELEGLVLAHKIRHDTDPVLAWMFANVKCHRAGDLIQPRKESDEKKIDGVTALVMAISRAMKRNAAPKADYENRGLWSI
jgi:phage terminase large subunit-like protein